MPRRSKFWTYLRRGQLSPLVFLTNNAVSLAGVVIVTTATIFWLFLLPVTLTGEASHPYIGILAFLIIPIFFFGGLILIPIGIAWKERKLQRRGEPTEFAALSASNPALRRLIGFVLVTTVLNFIIASQLTYRAVTYMDSVAFCGQACHTVMQPEFVAHQRSRHSQVDCVACHIGPGAEWFVRSKFVGAGQLVDTVFNTYPRPIPTPVHNLRTSRETCESCHARDTPNPEKLVVDTTFADDEKNTVTKTVLMMHVGAASTGLGIHGRHLAPGVRIRYASDPKRQDIPWVEYRAPNGKVTTYTVANAKTAGLVSREMDCVDCHNRPSHTFMMPDHAVDRAMAQGSIAASLPFAKKEAMELLRATYNTREDAAAKIPAAFESFYRAAYPAVYAAQRSAVRGSARAVLDVWNGNVFPAMKVTWGTYPNNIGHMDFPGCFRCHDGGHTAAGGQNVTQDCNACHNLIANNEPAPKILSDLGLAPTATPEAK